MVVLIIEIASAMLLIYSIAFNELNLGIISMFCLVLALIFDKNLRRKF